MPRSFLGYADPRPGSGDPTVGRTREVWVWAKAAMEKLWSKDGANMADTHGEPEQNR
jgi:hypothetical protein